MNEIPCGSVIFVCNICSESSVSQDLITAHVNENHVFKNDYEALRSITSYLVEPAPNGPKEFQTNVNETGGTNMLTETNSKQHTEDDLPDSKLWNPNATSSLINMVKEYDEDFQKKIKKTVWTKIAGLMNSMYGTNKYSWTQCDTKWKGLQRTYKDIKNHNSTSGKARKNWEFFDNINNILHKKPEINPAATCSSHAGLIVGPNIKNKDEISKSDTEETLSSDIDSKESNSYESSFKRKRKAAQNPIERRHKEKLERTDRFLDTFDKLVEVIIEKNKKKRHSDDDDHTD